MKTMSPTGAPHKRLNPLTGDWVLVSPHRTLRPWLGQTETAAEPQVPAHDPACQLCPGSVRANGLSNPDYTETFVFDNDFPALLPDGASVEGEETGLMVARAETGRCRVLCYSPRHDLSLGRLDETSRERVVRTWIAESAELESLPGVGYVQIFENRGAMMGASNPHPHGQIWATSTVPNEPAREQLRQAAYFESHESCLLCDYLSLEVAASERVIATSETFVAVVPFWAVWPFETMLLPRRHVDGLGALTGPEQAGLGEMLGVVTRMYDAVFDTPFPYSMGFHQRPSSGALPGWHLHAHFYPPLLRSATIRKFMVGYELLASPQRDLTPESAAATLRAALNR